MLTSVQRNCHSPKSRMKLVGILLLVASTAALTSKIQSDLLSSLRSRGSANIFVSFHGGTSNVIKSLTAKKFASRAEKITQLVSSLSENAKATQAKILDFLEKNEVNKVVRSFWISNQIYIENASLKLIQTLANFDQVSAITEEVFATIDEPTDSSEPDDDEKGLTWGLAKIQVPDVWNLTNGNKGQGIVVGAIDTGVLRTHEAIRDKYIGEYGWFDPGTGAEEPYDNSGHGTHVTGTILGSYGIGVAPEAKWMHCKGCPTNRCNGEHLLACGEFMLCPTLPDGSKKDCSKAPNIVSNSWSSGNGDTFFNEIMEKWIFADIVPLFSNGNREPYENVCNGARSPGDQPMAIAVGNTNIFDQLDPSSRQGPAVQSGITKPDVSAPGSLVKSAFISSDTSYRRLTGTSMACPHVAGVAALLLSHKPDLTVDQVRAYLTFGNEQTGLNKRMDNCGGISENRFPNNAFGHGRISALNSFNKLLADEASL